MRSWSLTTLFLFLKVVAIRSEICSYFVKSVIVRRVPRYKSLFKTICKVKIRPCNKKLLLKRQLGRVVFLFWENSDMSIKRVMILVLGVLILQFSRAGFAQTNNIYHNDDGHFSFSLPDGWVQASKD